MPNLIEKFYSYSPKKRLLMTITFLILVAASMAAYSFYNFYSFMKQFRTTISSPTKLPSLASSVKKLQGNFVDNSQIEALKEWDNLFKFSASVFHKNYDIFVSSGKNPVRNHNPEIQKQIFQSLNKFNSFKWENLYALQRRQIDIIEDKLLISLREVRHISTFLVRYQELLAKTQPETDISVIVEVSQKLARMTEVTSPLLIGKLFSDAVDLSQMRSLDKLLEKQLIKKPNIEKIRNILLRGYEKTSNPINCLRNELIFFKYVRRSFYAEAPLAVWILDQAFGDPEKEYLKVIQNLEKTHTSLEFLNKPSKIKGHVFLYHFFPQVYKGYNNMLKYSAARALFLSKLSDIINDPKEFIDPYSNSVLKSKDEAGNKIYYSVGPDLTDSQNTKDDLDFAKASKKY